MSDLILAPLCRRVGLGRGQASRSDPVAELVASLPAALTLMTSIAVCSFHHQLLSFPTTAFLLYRLTSFPQTVVSLRPPSTFCPRRSRVPPSPSFTVYKASFLNHGAELAISPAYLTSSPSLRNSSLTPSTTKTKRACLPFSKTPTSAVPA
jgi:hypothetical protein